MEEGEGEAGGEAEADGTEQAEGDTPMGLSRAAALAKLPSVSEWLRCCDPSHVPCLKPTDVFLSHSGSGWLLLGAWLCLGYTSVLHPSSGQASQTRQMAKAALWTAYIPLSFLTCIVQHCYLLHPYKT